MKLGRKSMLIASLILVVAGAAFALHNWYYRRYLWPAEIQRNVVGVELANGASLIGRESFSAFGQGMHRWRYEVSGGAGLQRMCGFRSIKDCRFVQSRRVSSEVEQTLSYQDGILVVEEIWS